eukprot:Clim_evm44s198 gene=Clim_evmTU44s198
MLKRILTPTVSVQGRRSFSVFSQKFKEATESSRLKADKTQSLPLSEPWPTLPPNDVLYSPAAKSSSTKISRVGDNEYGLLVASDNFHDRLASICVLVEAGSRYQDGRKDLGVVHALDRMAYMSTQTQAAREVVQKVEQLGGNVTHQLSRDGLTYTATVMKHQIPEAIALLSDIITRPQFSEVELEEVKPSLLFDTQEAATRPEVYVPELLHAAAFGDEGLGLPLYAPQERIENFSAQTLHDYHRKMYVRPRVCVSATGVEHDSFVDLVSENFGDLANGTADDQAQQQRIHELHNKREVDESQVHYQPTYRSETGESEWTHLSVGLKGLSHSDPDIYALAVACSLMGGGGSFSTGGPGKGMYSRLYTQVLNRYGWMEHIECQHFMYADVGLVSMYAKVPTMYAGLAVNVILDQFTNMHRLLNEQELRRAKNLFKCQILSTLEHRQFRVEDIARQVLASGRRDEPTKLVEDIEKVTPEDIRRAVLRVTRGVPCLATYGPDTHVPSIADIQASLEARMASIK